MKYYSDSQADLLRFSAEGKPIVVDDSNRQDCMYLRSEGLMRPHYVELNGSRTLVADITPEGRSYVKSLEVDATRNNELLEHNRKTRRLASAALTVSIISLLLAVLALVLQYL